MSGEDTELQPISLEEPPKKYVAVVYHHVSYQDNGELFSPYGIPDGKCRLVKDLEEKERIAVPDHLMLSLFSVLVCTPLGIVAVANSLKVKKAKDMTVALDASNNALQNALSALFVGPIAACAVFVCVFLSVYQA